MNGCKFCPAHEKCSVTYRGSSCAAIRYHYGLENDPEIVTNGDIIRAMNDEELAEWLVKTQIVNVTEAWEIARVPLRIPDGMKDGMKKAHLKWLQQPAEEKK